MMLEFFRSCLSILEKRKWFVVVFNWLFFGFLIIGAFLSSFGLVRVVPWPFGDALVYEQGNALFAFLRIFLFNLFFSGFLLLTASGALFFVLPVCFLLFRAFLWGALFSGLPSPSFLFVLPTLILEGEGYVLAAVAGLELGLSWVKPRWMFGEESLSGVEAFEKALRECAYFYVFVVLLLLATAIVETATLILLT